MTPRLYDPSSEAVARILSLFTDGPGHGIVSTPWLGEGHQSPAGHWLLPAGYSLYTSEEQEDVQTPAILIAHGGDARPYHPQSRAYWDCPVLIYVIFPRDTSPADLRMMASNLQCLLTEGIYSHPAGDRIPILSLLSTPEFRAHYISDITCTAEKAESGHPDLTITFTLRCSALVPP